MKDEGHETLPVAGQPDILGRLQSRTPARLLEGRAGAAYRTKTQLELREAHAAARDATRVELDLRAFPADFLRQWDLFETSTRATTKEQFLLYPDLGRHFDDASRAEMVRRCERSTELAIAMGDGLSVAALIAQVPVLLPALYESAKRRGWRVGRPLVIRHCRVGILNEIGEALAPAVAVLLIGERPGLATADSLSAYMAYRPNHQHTDADRNLISNIHERGLPAAMAAEEIVRLAGRMMAAQISGWQLKTGDRERNPATGRLNRGRR